MADELKRAKAVQEKAAEEEATKKGEFEHALASFKAKLEGFGKPSVNLVEISNEKKISFTDMRSELSKLENSQTKLLEEAYKSQTWIRQLISVQCVTCSRILLW